MPGKAASLALLLVSVVAAMSAWFATTASVAAVRPQWTLTPCHEALLTSSVQAGFVAGTCASALPSLADRFDLRCLFSASATKLSDHGLVGTMPTVQTCLGFLLTMASIQLLPLVVARVGWEHASSVLAIGPAFGIIATARLRARPEARRLASGRR